MKVQFIGIGGVGVSALAKMLLNKGYKISGINDTESPNTLSELIQKGVEITYGTNPEHLDKDADMYVYSVAWLQRAPELMAKVMESGKAKSYFEALGHFAKDYNVIAVSGTHGKTTTTAMLHEILKAHNFPHETIVGSILASEGSNYVPCNKQDKCETLLVEACEYKRHFLNFHPNFLVITNIEADHLDYFKDLDDVKDAFKALAAQVAGGGKVVANMQRETEREVLQGASAQVLDWSKYLPEAPKMQVIGEFNRQNAAAAMAAAASALQEGFDLSVAQKALSEFQGTWRRMETLGEINGATVISDYAHHPSEIKATLKAIKEQKEFTGKLIAVFEPHTYTRLLKLMDDFADSFTLADKVIVTPVYSAREEKVDGLENKLLEKLQSLGVLAELASSNKDAVDKVADETVPDDTIVLLTAGDLHKDAMEMLR